MTMNGLSEVPPLNNHNAWYYPSHGHSSDEGEADFDSWKGNWGKKSTKGSRWARRGKMAPWGPAMDDWKSDERARKRLKLLMPQSPRSPPPPSLPHLRSPSPPLVSPHPPPTSQHLTYASFVMEKSVTHSFRSSLLDELEQSTNSLIEGEGAMRRALGRLWQAMNQDAATSDEQLVPKQEEQEEDEEQDDTERRLARAPDLTPPTHKIFLQTEQNASAPVGEPSFFSSPERQLESLEKSLATLRELQDDGREYVERLQEIRETLGDARYQRDRTWDAVRERAIKEMQETAHNLTA